MGLTEEKAPIVLAADKNAHCNIQIFEKRRIKIKAREKKRKHERKKERKKEREKERKIHRNIGR